MQVTNTSYITELTRNEILEKAANIVAEMYVGGDYYTSPNLTRQFLSYKLSQHDREVFGVMFLNNQHQLIEYKELFFGTINAASVYPREVLKESLKLNAAAVIFAHNHPSGNSDPSHSDRQITRRLTDALALIDINVLDHFIVGSEVVSMAERGMI